MCCACDELSLEFSPCCTVARDCHDFVLLFGWVRCRVSNACSMFVCVALWCLCCAFGFSCSRWLCVPRGVVVDVDVGVGVAVGSVLPVLRPSLGWTLCAGLAGVVVEGVRVGRGVGAVPPPYRCVVRGRPLSPWNPHGPPGCLFPWGWVWSHPRPTRRRVGVSHWW